MRENKFRGRRIDTGEWIYGKLLNSNFSSFIVMMVNTMGGNVISSLVYHEVDQKSIGQYTGLKDKNGTEIYEEDIVTLFCQENRGEWRDYEVTGKVTYFEKFAQFLVKRENSHPQLGFDLFEMCDHEDYQILEVEVIGNIYENPELLEVEANA